MPDATTETVLTVVRGYLADLDASLAAEARRLPLSIFNTPVPRHYEIQRLREQLRTLDVAYAALGGPVPPGHLFLRQRPFRDVSRAKCARCGAPGIAEWTTCALGVRRLALCVVCDIGLNRVALGYVFGFERAAAFVARYEGQLNEWAQDHIGRRVQDQGREGDAPASPGRQRKKARSRERRQRRRPLVREV